MQKFLINISLIAIIGFTAIGCSKDFEQINTDPNKTLNTLPEQLLPASLVDIVNYNMVRNRNFNNELMQITVNMTDSEGSVFRYDFRATWADYLYNGYYSQLTNLKDMYDKASDSLTLNNSYKGISLVLQSWVYSLLTDTYGDVPYFESNKARPSLGGIREPKFDKQKDIYEDIFKKLDSANILLRSNTAIAAQSDPVFYGDVSRWRKFGNSLYLRLLMRVSNKSEVAGFVQQKFNEIVSTAGTYPLMSNNDESAILRWTGVAPYASPYLNIREQDFRAPGIANFFIDNLVAWNDPRIDIPVYGQNGINRWCIAPSRGAYVGVPSGYSPGSNPEKRSYFYSFTSARSLQTEPYTGMIMNYAELQFILAEAALKGWINLAEQPVDSLYRSGVKNSITLWLPNYDKTVDEYLTASDMQWLESLSFEEKMERIHLQKYYALFLTDMQQWFEYRRTGHPRLPKGEGLRNNGVMPARMTYPVYVQSTNPTNYKAAIAAQGPDLISTEVWWQKP